MQNFKLLLILIKSLVFWAILLTPRCFVFLANIVEKLMRIFRKSVQSLIDEMVEEFIKQ